MQTRDSCQSSRKATNNAAENEIIDSNFLPTKIFVDTETLSLKRKQTLKFLHPSNLNANCTILILKYYGIFLPTRYWLHCRPTSVEVTQGPHGRQQHTLQSGNLL
jgi:hypothetical protein